jgi:hypothetical protein
MVPTPEQVKGARESIQIELGLGITAAQDWCAAALHSKRRPFQQWETGERGMHPAFWELLGIKISKQLSERSERLPVPAPEVQDAAPSPEPVAQKPSVATILYVYVENGSKFTRGKKKAREDIDDLVLYASFERNTKKLNDCEYRLVITYGDDAELKDQIEYLFSEIYHTVDMRNCVIDDINLKNEATGLYWDQCDGGWR